MKIAVFDVDDTLIKHSNSESYYEEKSDSNFKELLDSKNYDKIYFYTNGTYGHGLSVSHHLGINDDVSYIYGRDNLRVELNNSGKNNNVNYMKPSLDSFNFVNSSIQADTGTTDNEIYFFDDLKKNLETAHYLGWKTILIQPNGIRENYIDYVFPNIYAALIGMV